MLILLPLKYLFRIEFFVVASINIRSYSFRGILSYHIKDMRISVDASLHRNITDCDYIQFPIIPEFQISTRITISA
jgi:hypothetical protein